MKNNKTIDSKKAYRLLTERIIREESDLKESKNRWILHCIYSGIAAGRIAKKLGLDSDYAMALGYIHDIGRRVSHPRHIVEGYYYMKTLGYPLEARICLTHSFINNDITLAAGPFPTEEFYNIITEHLKEKECSIYDNIIQLCDLFCLETGFTTLEKRILDISVRKGVFPCSRRHLKKAIELKEKLEKKMGCNLYDLFPEITKEDLVNREENLNQLEMLFSSVNFKPLNIVISEENNLPKENKSYYLDKLIRDGHNIFFISSKEKTSTILNKRIDVVYSTDNSSLEDLTEEEAAYSSIKKQDEMPIYLPQVSNWEEMYQQIAIISSTENISKVVEKSSNNHQLVKK